MELSQGTSIDTEGILAIAALFAIGGLLVGGVTRRWWCLAIVVVAWAVAGAPYRRYAEGTSPGAQVALVGFLAIFLVVGLAAATLGIVLGRRLRPVTARSPSPGTRG